MSDSEDLGGRCGGCPVLLWKRSPECGQGMKSRRQRRRRALWMLLQEKYSIEVYRSGTQGERDGCDKAGTHQGSGSELDTVVTATIQQDVIASWDVEARDEVQQVFDVLEEEEVFSGLFTDVGKLTRLPGKRSVLTRGQVADLESRSAGEEGACRWASAECGEGFHCALCWACGSCTSPTCDSG